LSTLCIIFGDTSIIDGIQKALIEISAFQKPRMRDKNGSKSAINSTKSGLFQARFMNDSEQQ
jgi:hypothetical protein